ncbi:hypothetical protein [Neolewinella antarctica]|uniref:MoxR-vWA-beta-propeller ternary system domain-containing protein n=1 Tax=Neolewinella antarctica TaxID=442734 RepID=A0ABX0XCT6_9BACT|nr:hypothetical protein [Neolewinella antarctica]NJC27101.1 hypothetical protein [Neolewinella antarctica]
MIDYTQKMPFLQAIEQLVLTNKLVLYGRIDEVPEMEMKAVLKLLEERFVKEATGYPATAPAWDSAATGWAVKVVFHAAQLLMYRSHEADALAHYFPRFGQHRTAAAIISADICLRYLPTIVRHLEVIDVEDELILILKEILREWHYTGLLADLPPEPANLNLILENECLVRLYVDRVIETGNEVMAGREELRGMVLAVLGNHGATYWKELKLIS